MSPIKSKPVMDPELKTAFEKVSFPPITHITPELVEQMRAANSIQPGWFDSVTTRGISHREFRITSSDNSNYEIILSIFAPTSSPLTDRPCFYWIHGGGLHWGDRFHTMEFPLDVVEACGAVCVSAEYRLAPEHAYSTAVEDCYAGLKWTSEHAEEIGIDPSRIMVGGSSAGGGLAAATVLLCRDRNGPAVCAQALICPMMDDRLTSVSSHQFLEKSDFLPRRCFEDLWKAALKDNPKSGGISPPGRAEDLSGLPTSFLDVGSVEILRDDSVAYAAKLWASGIQAELHVWAGGFHGFDNFLPDVAISKTSRRTKVEWVKRVFGL